MPVETVPVIIILQDIELVVEGVFVAETLHLCPLPLLHCGEGRGKEKKLVKPCEVKGTER